MLKCRELLHLDLLKIYNYELYGNCIRKGETCDTIFVFLY